MSAAPLEVWDCHPRNPLPDALLFEWRLVVKERVSSLDAWRVPLKVSAELLTVGHLRPPWLPSVMRCRRVLPLQVILSAACLTTSEGCLLACSVPGSAFSLTVAPSVTLCCSERLGGTGDGRRCAWERDGSKNFRAQPHGCRAGRCSRVQAVVRGLRSLMRCFRVSSPVCVALSSLGRPCQDRHCCPQTVFHVAIVIPPLPLLCGGGGALIMPEVVGQACCSL